MHEWHETNLGQYIKVQGGFAFKSVDFDSVGVPVIKIKNVRSRYIDMSEADCVSLDIAQMTRDYLLSDGDVVISMTGSGPNAPNSVVGRVARYTGKPGQYLINQRVGRFLIKDSGRVDKRFLFFLLSQQEVQDWLVSNSTGSANQANISNAQIESLRFVFPHLDEQKAIAAVLGALDDKIELNRRMNATLEGMARALFKSWFVDFDPVRAKIEGKQPFGMDAATAALFPSRLVPSPLGDIPEGWAVDEIGNAVTAVGGSTPSTERPEYWVDGHHAWATPKDLSSLKSPVLLSTERQITDAGISVISSGLLPAGTVLMSSRAPIGYIAIPEVPVAINQGFIAMVCNKKLPNLYVWLWTHSNLETIKNHSNGSTFQEISKGSFRPLPCIIPTDPVLKKFEENMSPIWQKIVFNTKETIKLEKQRDYLLPKLISGDIRIPDVEKFLEAA
jgi:type I restriction enzyme S subunit